jgi:hypothetical protein
VLYGRTNALTLAARFPMGGILEDIFGGGDYSQGDGDVIKGGGEFEPQNGTDGSVQSILTGTTVTGSPGAVPFRPGNWDWDINPPEYVIAQGDTGFGIAARYLGNGARWLEIRKLQTHADGEMGPNGPYLNNDTSILDLSHIGKRTGSAFRAGAVLIMPKEARDKAAELYGDDNVPQAATTGGAPGDKPGAKIGPGFDWKKNAPYLAAGAVAVAGVLVLAAPKSPVRSRSNPGRRRRRRRR